MQVELIMVFILSVKNVSRNLMAELRDSRVAEPLSCWLNHVNRVFGGCSLRPLGSARRVGIGVGSVWEGRPGGSFLRYLL